MSEQENEELKKSEPIQDNDDSTTYDPEEKSNSVVSAFLLGFVIAFFVAIILAVISIVAESEYMGLLIVGGLVVGLAIKKHLPVQTVKGAILGAILCPLTYIFYYSILGLAGYSYAEGESEFYVCLVLSAIFGAWVGYSKKLD